MFANRYHMGNAATAGRNTAPSGRAQPCNGPREKRLSFGPRPSQPFFSARLDRLVIEVLRVLGLGEKIPALGHQPEVLHQEGREREGG